MAGCGCGRSERAAGLQELDISMDNPLVKLNARGFAWGYVGEPRACGSQVQKFRAVCSVCP